MFNIKYNIHSYDNVHYLILLTLPLTDKETEFLQMTCLKLPRRYTVKMETIAISIQSPRPFHSWECLPGWVSKMGIRRKIESRRINFMERENGKEAE